MAYWDIGLRHIVDVDGQLLAIDAEVIDTASLLAKANLPTDRQLWLVRAGEYFALGAKQLLRLSQDEVLFFETAGRVQAPIFHKRAA
ncbi:MAG TPA: hypothetical protein VGN68_03040 [Sphingopyxis sp.]|jgi:hypothetical protein|uniref:hypothetical protein n=1 Tax=Sphingopyxis sp. TaxID=1908224 RepID=UPI002E0EF1C8|nr:hypothetical protein [Sphingopyxis sp.]